MYASYQFDTFALCNPLSARDRMKKGESEIDRFSLEILYNNNVDNE